MIDVLGALREGLAPHYTVEREIGAGGMARVFLAVERHPPRKVAVKVMNPDVSSSEFRERFIREVELTSRLSHPHIVPILAADECLFVPDGPDGLCYYVMPYIEGESLRAHIGPEQLMGGRAIDARTDVYSLGGVLHEMLVGEPPLVGLASRTSRGGAALDTVLRAQRVSHRSERLIRQTIGRALAPEPDERFASVDEFVASLRDVVSRGPVLGMRLPRVSRKVVLGGATVAVLGTAGVLLLGNRAPPLDPRRVVVTGFEDLSGDSALAPLGHIP